METMSMTARDEYLKVIRGRYFQTKTKKAKTALLDECCANAGLNRKYVISRIHALPKPDPGGRSGKPVRYGGEVKAALARVWEIFDYPCGQRLAPPLKRGIDRLRRLGEIECSDETARKLAQVSPATVDRMLRHEREVTHRLKGKGAPKPGHRLKQGIAIRLTQWDTSEVGNVEVDMVAHGGSSAAGEFVNTASVTEIASGWWEGVAIMGKSQDATFQALKEIRENSPFEWKALDSANGSEFMGEVLARYCARENIEFTRSRPGKKNDNAYIEEKNWTHVRKVVGYLRHDTIQEERILDDLYRHELPVYKNFFQPVMKLVRKERIEGKLKRKYDPPRTPFERLIESGQISDATKLQLEATYLSLNPADLKRRIDATLWNTSIKPIKPRAEAQGFTHTPNNKPARSGVELI